ncbi:hypothetical protein SMD44_07547 [Streptomyces alboflavus]|uniref:Uncharacterized protein n=1 Tax=Streptomyces alboflavus TaxID=67267 RepID=A0A1Z1WNU8_9ACTN|nr:hypothetical protein SMD44_07547 [Streptomyces alboflavus]
MFSPKRVPIAVRTSRQFLRNTSTTGGSSLDPCAAAASALACASRKTGDSETDRRIHRPTITRTPDSRNGTRQPQDWKVDSDCTAASSASTPVARRLPPGAPDCGQDAQKPRCLSPPCSETIRTAPPHSPPSAKPCTSRSTVRRMGAPTPIASYVGSRPIAKVAPPIRSRLSTSSFLRPTLSPKCPKTTPPRGRARKPMA